MGKEARGEGKPYTQTFLRASFSHGRVWEQVEQQLAEGKCDDVQMKPATARTRMDCHAPGA